MKITPINFGPLELLAGQQIPNCFLFYHDYFQWNNCVGGERVDLFVEQI